MNPVQTKHPFGDPAATQYHRDAEMLAELRRRATQPSLGYGRAPTSGQRPVSGEISTPSHAWTYFAVALYAAVMLLTAALALAL